ncbi:prephenate dehydratase [Buchananella hordeovulneris]|uniref:prephenate dehydratase n=1 Tax=Buchananella hordeovulneris TaxID=52770 RepID=UPI00163B27B4|nr:prephenate dehydratase [Buchananella hordeovulneris]
MNDYAFLGPFGTFTEIALRQVAGSDAQVEPCISVAGALDAVRQGRARYAVVPIENSIEGGVNATLDALTGGAELWIDREMVVPVAFVLAARPGTQLRDIRRVATHPHAWAQCRKWVAKNLPGATHLPATSTAAAAELLADADDPGYEAALCNRLSAEQYGLAVLADDAADNPDARTRFVRVTRPGPLPVATGADKTTLMVQLPDNEAGALLTMLEQFAARGVNLSRIESRPVGDRLGRYAFSIDVEGHLAEERVQAALIGLHRTCPRVTFLGSYPRCDGQVTAVLPGTRDADFAAGRAWIASLLGH